MRTSRTTRTAKTFRPKSAAELHRVWLKLVETNGPFLAIPPLKLAIPPLKEVWPQGMPALAGERLEVSKHLLNQVPATFTPADAVAAGVPRHAVYGWRDAGQIVEISRGVYRKADAPTTAYVDLIAVAKRAPRGVVCLVSALAVHELTDEIPSAVQMAVPNGVNVPRIAYPPTEFSRFDADTFDLGRIRFEAAHGEWVAVYFPERAVADAMRLRHRVGDQVALRALRAYLCRRDARPAVVAELARQLGDACELLRAMQVVLS